MKAIKQVVIPEDKMKRYTTVKAKHPLYFAIAEKFRYVLNAEN